MTDQNNRPRVIGIHGKKQSGKDTSAMHLAKSGYERVAFADPVKASLYRINPDVNLRAAPKSVDFYYLVRPGHKHVRLQSVVNKFGWEIAKGIPDVRRMLQNTGEEIRGEDPLVWIRIAKRKAEEILERGGKVVFTDLRYDNEAAFIRSEFEGLVVQLERPDAPKGDTHKSESGINPFLVDVTLHNDAGFEDLHSKWDELLSQKFFSTCYAKA